MIKKTWALAGVEVSDPVPFGINSQSIDPPHQRWGETRVCVCVKEGERSTGLIRLRSSWSPAPPSFDDCWVSRLLNTHNNLAKQPLTCFDRPPKTSHRHRHLLLHFIHSFPSSFFHLWTTFSASERIIISCQLALPRASVMVMPRGGNDGRVDWLALYFSFLPFITVSCDEWIEMNEWMNRWMKERLIEKLSDCIILYLKYTCYIALCPCHQLLGFKKRSTSWGLNASQTPES